MKKLIKLILILSLPVMIFAQQKTELGVMLGASNYQGDIASSKAITFTSFSVGGGFYAKRHLSNHFTLRGNLFATTLKADDLNFVDEAPWRADRSLNFSTSIYELTVLPEYHLFGNMIKRKKIRPYLFAGIGAVYAKVSNNLSSEAVENQEGHYPKYHLSFPIGGGLNFDLNNKLVLGLELSGRLPVSDYLDGISESATVSLEANTGVKDFFGFGGVTLGYKIGSVPPSIVDTDGDGVNDDRDSCPLVAGDLKGCPDTDSDGVADIKDDCPDMAGDARFAGCPDTDADGIVDKDDDCPDTHGLLAFMGCPDTDADGIADKDDKCPEVVGSLASNGCPDDRDGDGVIDADDECPDVKGTLTGCPDSDADGIADIHDTCPFVAGLKDTKGCPDQDKDGIADANDKCPDVPGLASESGCPEVLVTKGEETENAFTNLVEDIYFITTRANINEKDYSILDKVAKTLKENPNLILKINGYTDNVGELKINEHLSMRRARRCYKYLAQKGIPTSRMSFEGFGPQNPKHNNESEEGRKMNRRVEFTFLEK